jgi:hypothetical protein
LVIPDYLHVPRAHLVVGSALVLASCGAAENPATLSRELQQLQSKVAELERTVALQGILGDSYRDAHKAAMFDPSASAGFSRVDANLGTFAVSMQDVRPYGDGIRVRANLGNLTSATFDGVELSVTWGARSPYASTDTVTAEVYEAWRASLRETTVRLTDNLRPGHWNPVSFLLPATDLRHFGYIEVGIVTDRISLY